MIICKILISIVCAIDVIGVSTGVFSKGSCMMIAVFSMAINSRGIVIVVGIGFVVNIIGILIIRKDSNESLNMKGAYFEVLSDMLTSVGVMIAGVIMLTTQWYYADPIISAAIGLLIIPRTLKLLMEAVNVLLEGTPKDVDISKLRSSLEELSGISIFPSGYV